VSGKKKADIQLIRTASPNGPPRGIWLTPQRFHAAVDRVGPLLWAWFRRRISNGPQEVDELTHQTMIRAWVKRSSFLGDSPDDLRRWIFGIAQKILLEFFRQQQRQWKIQNAIEADNGLFSPISQPVTDDHLDLRHCFEALSRPDRLILAHFYGLRWPTGYRREQLPKEHSDGAVAKILANLENSPWSRDRVRQHRHRARLALLDCLAADGTAEAPPSSQAPQPARRGPMSTSQSKSEKRHTAMALLEALEQAQTGHPEALEALSREYSHDDDTLERILTLDEALRIAGADPPTPQDALDPPRLEASLLARLHNIPVGTEARMAPSDMQGLEPVSTEGHRDGLQPLRRNKGPAPAEETPAEVPVGSALSAEDAPSTVPWIRPLALMAATVALVVGLAQWTRDAGDTPTSVVMERGEDIPHPAPMPLQVVASIPGEEETHLLPLTEVGPQRWRGGVPMTAAVQVRVQRPETAARASNWPLHMTLFLVNGGQRVPVPGSGWTRQVEGQLADVAIGPTVQLAALEALGATRGSHLEFRIQRDQETVWLELVLEQ